jgi:hypothetical protein
MDLDDDANDDIIIVQPAKKIARSSSKALYELQPAPTRDAAAKAGFISSASKWMSRLPTLGGLFSPSRHAFDTTVNEDIEEEEEEEALSPAVVGRKRKTTHQLGRSHSQPELSVTTRTSRAKRPAPVAVSDTPASRSKRPRISHTQSDPAIVVDSESEDELLLSPESARQRKAEEEKASKEVAAARSPVKGTQHSTGRFDGKSTLLHIIAPKLTSQTLLHRTPEHSHQTQSQVPPQSHNQTHHQSEPPTMPVYSKWSRRQRGKRN